MRCTHDKWVHKADWKRQSEVFLRYISPVSFWLVSVSACISIFPPVVLNTFIVILCAVISLPDGERWAGPWPSKLLIARQAFFVETTSSLLHFVWLVKWMKATKWWRINSSGVVDSFVPSSGPHLKHWSRLCIYSSPVTACFWVAGFWQRAGCRDGTVDRSAVPHRTNTHWQTVSHTPVCSCGPVWVCASDLHVFGQREETPRGNLHGEDKQLYYEAAGGNQTLVLIVNWQIYNGGAVSPRGDRFGSYLQNKMWMSSVCTFLT